MGRTKKMITVETERVTVIRRHGPRAQGWCEKCSAMVRLLSEEEVLEQTRTGERQLHGVATQNGTLLVCPNSLGSEQTQEASKNVIRQSEKTKE